METPNALRMLEATRVSRFRDTPESAAEFALPLTFLDTLTCNLPTTEFLLFYRLTESTPEFFNSVIVPRLKRALSLSLVHYLPIAGRLMWDPRDPKPKILYTPYDGVSFVIAESATHMTRLLGFNDEVRSTAELRHFIPKLTLTGHVADTFALQATSFPGQGFSLGVTAHHAVLDGRVIAMFLKALAHACKEELKSPYDMPKELMPFYDRSSIQDTRGLGMELFSWWRVHRGLDSDPEKRNLILLPEPEIRHGPESVRVTYKLTRRDVKNLREKLLRHKKIDVSGFVITYAYVVTCMVKTRENCKPRWIKTDNTLRQRVDDNDRKVCIAFLADFRGRLRELPLPNNYFGNCLGIRLIEAKAGDFTSPKGFEVAAEKITNMIMRLDKEVLENSKVYLSANYKEIAAGTQRIVVAGSTRFGLYEIDFGWGKPAKVENLSIDNLVGAVNMFESGDGSGGIEVSLSLERGEMEVFASVFRDGLTMPLAKL